MGAFGGLIFTNNGRNLQAKGQTGVTINFNRIAVGDGNLGGQSIPTLNALISEKKSLPITKLKTLPDGKAVVGAFLSNADIVTGFYLREIGVFAQDPDLGEILYCYGNAGANAEYIPPGGGPDIVEKYLDAITIVQNVSSITATIEQSLVFATQVDFQTEIDKENARQIENIGFGIQSGLNTTASIPANMNVHVQPGTVYMSSGARYAFSTETIFAVTAADVTNPRKDIIYVSSNGIITYTAGTPAAVPAEPALPTGALKLCVIDVPAGDAAVEQTQITDARTMKKIVAYQTDLDTHKTAATLDHPDSSVTTAKLADGAVTLVKLAANSVDASKIVDGSIGTAEIADGSVTAAKVAADIATKAELDAHLADTAPHSAYVLQKSGGTMTGTRTSAAAAATAMDVDLITQGGTNITKWQLDTAGILRLYKWVTSAWVEVFNINASGILQNGANKYWHAGNDGAGSTLDADLLDGKDSTAFSNSFSTGSTADPNTTQEAYILTNHANSPGLSLYWHIRTYFYTNLTGNRAQIAVDYNGTNRMFIRHYFNTAWTAWTELIPASGGTMTGILTAQNNTSYTTKQVRNITLSTADPSGGGNGDIWIKYTP